MSVFAGRISQAYDVQGSLSVDQSKTLAEENTSTGPEQSTGTGDSITMAASVATLVDAGASFTTADIGRFITISGASNGGNNGEFLIEEYVSGTSIKYTNSSGVTETSSFTWKINDPYSLQDDINFERTDRKLIKGTTNYYDAIPTYVRPSAIGTDVDANLTNIAGMTLDAFTKVIDVKQAAVLLRPDITDTDGNVAISDETFTTTNFHFKAGDLGSFITISSGPTGADGTYRIKTVTDGQTLELEGLAATAAGSATWKLESDLKEILSSRNYADSVDRRGVPIADSGEYDETNYNATFADFIDPVVSARPVEEDGDPIWARAYGDEKDSGSGNEGTRFFLQLMTGANSGAASDSSLEIISGRSGTAASVTNGAKTITGLASMTNQDEGRYITLFDMGADQADHFLISSVDSASQVTVIASGNFVTDANDGSIKWQISRHPGSWDFYNGDRYRKDEVSETASRTTLVGGIIADAEISQDVGEIREWLGAQDGETSPDLTNTGLEYVFSDLANPADTTAEEIFNTINAQIGDRSYTGSTLNDGEDIATSLQNLSDAIAAASVTRTIERLSSAVPKQTAHTLPGGLTYTLDGTDNGLNLWVFWRKQLRDPGSVANDDDYDETSTTQITPFEKVEADDHINYFKLQ
jgi:hypothetical protein